MNWPPNTTVTLLKASDAVFYIANFDWRILGSHKQNVKRQNRVSLLLKHVVQVASIVLEHFIWKRLERKKFFFLCEKCNIISSNCFLELKIQKFKAFHSLMGSFCQRYMKIRETGQQRFPEMVSSMESKDYTADPA